MRKITGLAAALFVVAITAGTAHAQVGPPHVGFWVDGQTYHTVATPTALPGHGPKDGIYVFANLDGQMPVAEAKPGDQDYNGGRWQVVVLKFTDEGLAVHDADGDGMADFQLTSWEAVEEHIGLGHLEFVTYGPSFVCPVIR